MATDPKHVTGSTRTSEPTRRVFFALWPDGSFRTSLAHATHKAVRACGGRPVPVHNLHATLLFLGSIAESRIVDVGAIAASAASSVGAGCGSAAELFFDRVECWEKAAVLVATTSAASSGGHMLARTLAEVLQRETLGIGLTLDPKPFRPHITLARKVGRPGRALSMRPVSWNLTEFALVESRTEPEGAVYGVLQVFPLANLQRQSM